MNANARSLRSETDALASDFLDAPWGTHRPKALQRALMALTRRTVLQRGVFRPTMTRWILGLGRPLDITFRGCRYRIGGTSNLIEYGMLTRPTYNAVEIDFLSDAVRAGGVMVDIGSNVGLYSLPIARAAGPKGRVIAIDANHDMVRHLGFNAKASELDNVTTVHCAVGDSEGRVDLEILKDDVAIVNVVESATGGIAMRPLLAILADAGVSRVDSLKIDIEGHEDKALVPFFQGCPARMMPTRVVIERAGPDGDYPGCVAEFDRLGYRLVTRTRNNSLYERA